MKSTIFRFIISTLLLFPFTIQAYVFFTDGMEWKNIGSPLILPPPDEHLVKYSLEGDSVCDGHTWFRMYKVYDDNKASRKFVGLVRTEGDKVYYKDQYDTGLLYDFGLQPGDICHIGTFSITPGRHGYQRYIKCVENDKHDDSARWKSMSVETYSNPECTGVYEMPGRWIQGLGGVRGVSESNFEFAEGGSAELVQASINGNVIFQKEDSYFNTPKDNSIIKLERLTLDITNKKRVVPVRVYTSDGMLIYDEIVKHASISLPGDGEYIIRIGTLEPVSITARQLP